MKRATTAVPATTDMDIRHFSLADQEAVVALWNTTFPDDPPWNKPQDIIAAKMALNDELFFVGTVQDVLVGTIIAGYDGVRGWVHKMAIHPDHQRRGYAQALLTHAEHALAARGCRKLNLQVRHDNLSAVALYQRAGFAIEPRTSMGKRIGSANTSTETRPHPEAKS